MRIHWRAAASVALILAVASVAGGAMAQAGPKVRIDSGELVGAAKGDVVSFKGVPYAAAPVGALRWAPPKKHAPWTTPRAADSYGAICPQKLKADGTPNEGGASGASSEDCLFLNVWAPKGATKAPVMVWLHGGGNSAGAGSLGAYEGSAFVRDGVILVTLNYRLGPLGFFAHPALTKAARPDEPLVAYGIMDQIAALQWVKRNIA
ncbi:MAG: carboxylesterase family protein, partial [Caulobacteraceae bacterium]|nr:carboxylesterase family protein [Caulobacteraceae bacterium]